jgi:hypothetical protein
VPSSPQPSTARLAHLLGAAQSGRVVLQDFTALSDSLEWELGARYFRTRYARAERVTLVCDDLNTNTNGVFYEAFEPQKARSVVRRLEFCPTPKHGSWLNTAENELSSMTRQCSTGRRFATVTELRGYERLAPAHQRTTARRRLAIQGRRRTQKTEVHLPSITSVTKHWYVGGGIRRGGL